MSCHVQAIGASRAPSSLDLRGSGGQSFGCFLAGGVEVKLTGEANDYIGKGMAGGELVIVPPPGMLHHETHLCRAFCAYLCALRVSLMVLRRMQEPRCSQTVKPLVVARL